MTLTLSEFITKYNNQAGVGDTDLNRGQCVGLVEVWTDNLNLPHEYGNAKDLLTNADLNYFDVIHNTPLNVPTAGDIIVWGIQVGEFGHTAIFVDGDPNTFHSFDQNFPLGSPCHLQLHNYFGVLGWLHPKTPPPVVTPPTPSVDELRAISVLQSHFPTATTKDNQPFGNLEGYSNTLTQDAYYAYKHQSDPLDLHSVATGVLFKELLSRFGLK